VSRAAVNSRPGKEIGMIDDIFSRLPPLYRKGGLSRRTTFYFAIDDIRKTVILDGESCSVDDGKTTEQADCVCKTSSRLFLKVWNEGYAPGITDFMSGAIKSNAPHLLQQFLTSFGK
jgi:putative sterol carrier protein